jgi:hypothetical protein
MMRRLLVPLTSAAIVAASLVGASSAPAGAAPKIAPCTALFVAKAHQTKATSSQKSSKSLVATIAKDCPTLQAVELAVRHAVPKEKPAAVYALAVQLQTLACRQAPRAKLCSSKA